MANPSIGFVGFGEAGFHMGRGFREASLPVIAFDDHAQTPGLGDRIQLHSKKSGVQLVASPQSLASQSEILFSVVTADQAVAAAESFTAALTPSHVWVDLNSVSPDVKRSVSDIVSSSGARFVEGAIMAAIAAAGHRSPILLAGEAGPEFRDRMSAFGMRLEYLSDKIGAASAVKLCRSIVVKGLEAVMLECALAACHYDADARVFDSLNTSFPGLDWRQMADHMVSRAALHGTRRAREMEEAARMLESIGIDPIMTAATARRQEWSGKQDLGPYFGGEPPEDYRTIIEAIRTRNERSDRRIPSHGE